ncbi:di-heme-cytochrome C peroxidase [Brevundimonas lenta]|uniref:Mono/diheme cytochrome c family protein n=1 Tax=Brevundimonas lenta TaxID=424796 RepID=A0A7W6NPS7_9CAUL|nr:di-heme-cytochrome C peroxidase [Brevundimonas lenta]MBB4082849.1 mono/diheme cytochrome c family protein [Brevundimonas lenta]
MKRTLNVAIASTAVMLCGAIVVSAADAPPPAVDLEQGIDQATLDRYHHTDQGTRLLPAAWLAALEKPDGSGKVMNTEDLRRYGFLVDNVQTGPGNPYGWPLGWTVSDPAQNNGVAIAGFSCAMCHTGQIEYQGKVMVVEGGQSMIDLFPFIDWVATAFAATATDPVMRAKFFEDAIAAGYPADRMATDFDATVGTLSHLRSSTPGAKITMLPGGPGRVDAVQGIANRVFGTDLMIPSNQRDATAPVSYPYLWDIWRLSWLQYNGFIPANADSRNIGEVLGTIAKTNFVGPDGSLNPEPERWRTSVQIRNLQWMEATLRGLKAPTWPTGVLGDIDQDRATAGRELFVTHCTGCHGIKALPDGNWDVTVVPLEHIGTDPNQATNWAGYTYDLTKLGMSTQTPANVGTSTAINAIRRQLYADAAIPASEQDPDVEFLAPCGYKARPLIGVWATPPFLHNGAVRTVFDLLSDTRPATFTVGTREYDPVHLGYADGPGLRSFTLDTSVSGNSNAGHWWTDDTSRPGRIGPRLNDDQKFAIIEFLKAATYDNYPTESRAVPGKVACADPPDWARQARAG